MAYLAASHRAAGKVAVAARAATCACIGKRSRLSVPDPTLLFRLPAGRPDPILEPGGA